MTKKLIVIVLLFFTTGILFNSCDRSGSITYFVFDDLLIDNIAYEDSDKNDECIKITERDTDSIHYSNFALEIMLISETFYSLAFQANTIWSRSFALSPAPPIYDASFTSFKIFSNKRIDDQHEAFTDISSLFEMTDFYYPGCAAVSQDQLIDYLNNTDELLYRPVYFRLIHPIEEAGTYQFFIEIEQESTRVPLIEAESGPVNLKSE